MFLKSSTIFDYIYEPVQLNWKTDYIYEPVRLNWKTVTSVVN